MSLAGDSALSPRQLVVFKLSDQSFGLDIFSVSEIIRPKSITPVPRSSRWVRGLVNLRGRTIPVVDLRERLGLPNSGSESEARIVVVESDQGQVGLLVDAVSEVRSMSQSEIEATPAMIAGQDGHFVDAVAHSGNDLISILNLAKALAA